MRIFVAGFATKISCDTAAIQLHRLSVHPGILRPSGLLALLFALVGAAMAGDTVRANFSGTWKLDRAISDPAREMLRAQGWNAIEVQLLDRVPVTQAITQTVDGLRIEIRATIITTSEYLRFDGQPHAETSSVLGPLTRVCSWSPDGAQLITRTEYKAKSGMGAEMIVTRSRGGADRLDQITEVKLADGRSFRARQVFMRK